MVQFRNFRAPTIVNDVLNVASREINDSPNSQISKKTNKTYLQPGQNFQIFSIWFMLKIKRKLIKFMLNELLTVTWIESRSNRANIFSSLGLFDNRVIFALKPEKGAKSICLLIWWMKVFGRSLWIKFLIKAPFFETSTG